MTDWTPEEERVARALEPDAWFNRENAFADFPDVADEVVRPSIEQAKRAISAMQPRWRDVKTDPPAYGKVVLATDGVERVLWSSDYDLNNCRRFIGVREFYPTLWCDLPPLPPALEDKP